MSRRTLRLANLLWQQLQRLRKTNQGMNSLEKGKTQMKTKTGVKAGPTGYPW
jgi:hypothetical protein